MPKWWDAIDGIIDGYVQPRRPLSFDLAEKQKVAADANGWRSRYDIDVDDPAQRVIQKAHVQHPSISGGSPWKPSWIDDFLKDAYEDLKRELDRSIWADNDGTAVEVELAGLSAILKDFGPLEPRPRSATWTELANP